MEIESSEKGQKKKTKKLRSNRKRWQDKFTEVERTVYGQGEF